MVCCGGPRGIARRHRVVRGVVDTGMSASSLCQCFRGCAGVMSERVTDLEGIDGEFLDGFLGELGMERDNNPDLVVLVVCQRNEACDGCERMCGYGHADFGVGIASEDGKRRRRRHHVLSNGHLDRRLFVAGE